MNAPKNKTKTSITKDADTIVDFKDLNVIGKITATRLGQNVSVQNVHNKKKKDRGFKIASNMDGLSSRTTRRIVRGQKKTSLVAIRTTLIRRILFKYNYKCCIINKNNLM